MCDVTLLVTPPPLVTNCHNFKNPLPPSKRDIICGRPPRSLMIDGRVSASRQEGRWFETQFLQKSAVYAGLENVKSVDIKQPLAGAVWKIREASATSDFVFI
ncbi:hypothetical protein AVEN_250442-1 [Araneus ventricosus]|uniref:Uncharacterized protein n=1 Tax=Araneus ventricosus TaxID=182803 RepID=A0A4Y2EHQ4_ARAVE|nr:hypothetical protein AVEN_250442-1 [Araneus ventricosus]